MRTLAVIVAAIGLTACATTETGDRARRDQNVLTLEEIQESNADQFSAYDLIRNRRPAWLRTRGSNSIYAEDPIMVYVDGSRLGGPEVLETIPAMNIEEARFYGPAQAQARFGLGNTNGAIAITTRRG
ncbi:MAG: hypothetical protein P8177_03625 [Gemmatimonadota bacterium]|jgi:hypothetical protein